MVKSKTINGLLPNLPMKKATRVIGKILYFILAMSPIFALGYMLGIKLIQQ
jgi:hypothetical protein